MVYCRTHDIIAARFPASGRFRAWPARCATGDFPLHRGLARHPGCDRGRAPLSQAGGNLQGCRGTVRQARYFAKVDLRLQASTLRLVKESAERHGCSVAQWIREAITGRLAIETTGKDK